MSPLNTNKSNLNGHVAVIAFPFGSHPMTLLNLTLKLALDARSVRFSFFNTAKSNTSLFDQPKYQSLPCNVRAYDVEDGHSLFPRPQEAMDPFLKAAPESFKRAMDAAYSETGAKVTCLLSDAFLIFAGDLARGHLNGVPWIALWSPFPCSLSAHLHTKLIRDHCVNREDEGMSLDFIPGLSDMKVGDLPGELISEGNQESQLSQALTQSGTVLPRDCTALVLSFYETLSPDGLTQDLKSKFRNVLNVGFLTLSTFSAEPESTSSDSDVISWLDKRDNRSVVYLAFGTVVALPSSEMIALAEALEESNVPFLWSLKDHLKADLPAWFEERTSRQGKIVSWAPQQRVLQHRSVGVFVNQGGSNSIHESIAGQVPMICRPFFADNFMMARMVEDVWKVGLKIESKMFSKNEVLKGLDLILGQAEDGKLIRENVCKLKETILEASGPDGSAAQDFRSLVGLVSSTHY